MSHLKEQKLWDACAGDSPVLVKDLADDPAVDVNWADPKGNQTALYNACFHGRASNAADLLKSPKIDVNKAGTEGITPFYLACAQGHQKVVLLLLKDLRVNVNKPNHNQLSPLSYASQEGHLSVLQSILASGRDVNTWVKSIAGPASWNDKTAVEIARAQGTRAKSAGDTGEDHKEAAEWSIDCHLA